MSDRRRKDFDTVSLDMLEELGFEIPDPQTLNAEDDALFRIDFERAITSLPEREREIFQRVAVEGYTQQEEAERLGVDQATVSRGLSSARKRIQDFLNSGA